jgi:hypothetical protein
MAVLVMPLLGNCVLANGVGVTMNPYRPDMGGVLLNVQAGTLAVTDACGGATPEQLVITNDNSENESIQRIAQSSVMPPGTFLITKKMAGKLKKCLLDIELSIGQVLCGEVNAIDAEFFILKTEEIVVVQARLAAVQERPTKAQLRRIRPAGWSK